MSLVQHLKGLAAHQPEALLYGWFERSPTGITLKRSYTYREAWDRVQALAHALISKAHIQPGDRILLCYPPCIDFLFAFLGCMLADAVPVPSYPPNPQALKATIPAFAKVKQLTDAKIVLTNRQYRKWTSLSIFAEWPSGLRWITTDSLFAVGLHLSHDIPCPQVTPEDLAFLQFTSGSTGDPKGVMISHGVIWESFRGMTAGQATRIRPAYPPSVGRVAVTPNTSEISPFTMVSWLPLYHDLGLILAALMPIYRAGNAFLGSPLDFVAQPTSWLIAISQFRANASAAPNFAFDLVRKRWQKMPESMRPKIDLSCVKLIVNGGEPIRKATLEKFAATFHQQGFRAEALCPSYGMAECTVAACAEHSTELVSSTLRPDLVSSGSNFQESGMLVGILKQDWRTVKDLQITADGEVGEIAVTGNALSSGYWGATKLSNFIGRDDLPSELQDLAALHPDIRSDCWYVTGDLGMLEHGHLFVTGRIKDLIIIRGRNYVATDLQTTVMESIPEVRPGCIAAIAVPHGNSSSEEALLLCETRSVLSNAEGNVIIKNIQRCVRDAHGIQVHVALLKKGCLPKTSSGKLQRSKTSQMWQTQAFKPLAMSLETENSFEKTPKTSSTDSVFQSSHTSVDVLLSNPSAIMDELSLAWDPRADYSRRFSALSTQIIRIIQSNLPIEEDARNEQPSVTVESVFTELGLDSISAATILQNAQDEANHILVMKKFEPIMLRPSLLFEHLDVNSLVQYLISISASIPDNILEHKSESLKDKTRDIRELPRQTTTNHYIFFLVAQGLWICIIWAIILHAARLSVSLVSLCGPLYRLLTILIGHFVFLLMLATLVVVLKKYIIGTFETGVHPLYGPYHLRFWMVESAVRCLDLVGMTSFHDTIVYETFLAAMGVSISPGATINTSINTAFDLLSIGRHSIVARSSTIQCHNYQMQCLVLGRVSIDELVVIDERAVIQISGTAWNHESSIPQSYQPETTHIALPTPEVIGGSSTLRPCRRHGTRVRSHLPSSPNIWYEMSNVPAIRWLYAFVLFVLSDAAVAIASIFSVSAVTRLFGLKFAEGNYLGIFPFVFGPHIFGPNKALLERINGNLAFETTILSENSVSGPVSFVPETGVTWCLLSSTVTYFFWILSMAFITIVVQHLLVPPPMHGGVVHGHSYSGAVRQFYGNLMRRLHSQASFLTTGTILTTLFYNLSGAKIGKGVMFGLTQPLLEPKLFVAEDGCFLGDFSHTSCVSASATHSGEVYQMFNIHLKQGSMVSMNAVVKPQTPAIMEGVKIPPLYLPERCILGANSSYNHNTSASVHDLIEKHGVTISIFGDQKFRHRAGDELMALPTYSHQWRAAYHFLWPLIILPGLLFLFLLSFLPYVSIIETLSRKLGPEVTMTLTVPLYAIYAIGVLCQLVIVKWIVMQRFTTGVHEVYSVHFLRRLAYSHSLQFASLFVLDMMRGTQIVTYVFKVLGARIGQRVLLDTLTIAEPDLCEIQDGCCVNSSTLLFSHCLERGRFLQAPLRILNGSSIGSHCVLLLGTTLGEYTNLEHSSATSMRLSLPGNGCYYGVPARLQQGPHMRTDDPENANDTLNRAFRDPEKIDPEVRMSKSVTFLSSPGSFEAQEPTPYRSQYKGPKLHYDTADSLSQPRSDMGCDALLAVFSAICGKAQTPYKYINESFLDENRYWSEQFSAKLERLPNIPAETKARLLLLGRPDASEQELDTLVAEVSSSAFCGSLSLDSPISGVALTESAEHRRQLSLRVKCMMGQHIEDTKDPPDFHKSYGVIGLKVLRKIEVDWMLWLNFLGTILSLYDPATTTLLSSTRRMFNRAVNRVTSVDALILPGLVWGRLSRRGEESRKRLNIIHGRYAHTSNGVIMVLMSMIDSLEVFRARMDLPSWSNLEWNSLYWIMRDQMIAMGVSPNDLAMNWRDELSKHRSRMRNMKCGHWSVIARMVDHSLEAYLERFPPEARRQLRQLLAVACPEEMLVGIGFDKSYPADDDFYALKETIQMIHLEEEDRLRRPHCLSAHFEIHGSKPRFEVFGPHDRSRNMPQILTDSHSSIADLRPRSDNHMASYRRNLGYATNQPPVRGVEDVLLPDNLPKVSREEVALHCTTELGYWVIIGSYVYDVSILVEDDLHPGGGDVLRKYAGQDASGIVKVHSEDARIVACNYIVAKVLGSAGDVRR